MLNGYRRTIDFIKGEAVDHPPLHPIIMRFAAVHAGVAYRDFCLDSGVKCSAMIKCADDFGLDWVTVMSDPYAEAEAFGMKVHYPEDSLPQPSNGVLLRNFSDSSKIRFPEISSCKRMLERIKEIETYRNYVGGKYLITGWAEGPIAVYSLIRGLSDACMDFFDHADEMKDLFKIFAENAKEFVRMQIRAGADCIGIGDAAASQIGPELYGKYIQPLEKEIVDVIHEEGALAKIHICGDTSSILRLMIEAGFDIIDVDHLVGSVRDYLTVLSPKQVFSGYCDPVADVLYMTDGKDLYHLMQQQYNEADGRLITSAGCEIPGETSENTFREFCRSAGKIGR